MFASQIRVAVAGAHNTAQLDTFARSLWGGLAEGMITEAEASAVAEELEARRQAMRGHAGRATDPSRLAVHEPRRVTLFARARRQSPPDNRKSIERRRRLAASGPLPPALACAFTTGELAVLRIVADEVRAHGVCSRTVAELAARAGVAETTVRNAVRQAVARRLLQKRERPRPGRKHLANLLSIVSKEWRTWIDRRPPAKWGASTGCKFPQATTTEDKKLSGMRGEAEATARSKWPPSAGSTSHRPQPALVGSRDAQ